MPKIKITRKISEIFNVSEEEASRLIQLDRQYEFDDIWDWFHMNETGLHSVDYVKVERVSNYASQLPQ